MTPDGSLATARPSRLLDRVAGVSVILGLLLAAMPTTGLAGHSSPNAGGPTSLALLDPAQLTEALSRGELPVELLVAGSVAALAVGFALTLLVGRLRGRRRPAPDPAPAQSETRTTLPWPVQNADAFPPTPPQSVGDEPLPFQRDAPPAPLEAVRAETWAAREAAIEVARDTSGWPAVATEAPHIGPPDTLVASTNRAVDAPAEWQRTTLPVPATAGPSIQSVLAPQDDVPSTRSMLGTPEAPLVVELHDGRGDRAGRRAGPNLPLVAMIGTVAVGVAFSTGAAVGATLGVGAGAAIGIAFATGAGVAIGATVALLGGRR